MENFKEKANELYELKEKDELYSNFVVATKVLDDLRNHDPLFTIIIKGNLLVENHLEDLLVGYGYDKKRLSKKMLNYKLNLCAGLSLIEKEKESQIDKLNNIRNNYGHEINFKFEQKHLDEMVGLFNKDDKALYNKMLEISNEDDELCKGVSVFIAVIITNLRIERMLLNHTKYNIASKWEQDILAEIIEYKINNK